ncbi:MAG: TIGR03862 family flavoprotein [Caldilineaceae bacterium]
MKKLVVIGGGPAGLMAAEVISQAGLPVHLYDAMPSVGRKFLLAGKGGLNLTHSEPYSRFLERYDTRQGDLEPIVNDFRPDDLRAWAGELGVETFVGTSGRVFPTEMKAAPLLRAWLRRLRRAGVIFHLCHRWLGWDDNGRLRFATRSAETQVETDAVILALGGASWPKLGSDGGWVPLLAERGVPIAPLRPANCGFDVGWTKHFRSRFEGQPVKPVAIRFTDATGRDYAQQGEFIVTTTGVEGSLIYALSAPVRDMIEATGRAILHLDLAPDWSEARLIERLSQPRGKRSVASHLKRAINLDGVKTGLLWEFLERESFDEPRRLAAAIKALPIPLLAPRPIAEAISTAGGVAFEALDEHLMLRAIPGVFVAGEMLDWEAPTGGYLLTASFATGRTAGLGAVEWIQQKQGHGFVQMDKVDTNFSAKSASAA